jgi:hypothetical protein
MRRLPETISHFCTSSRLTPLGDNTYILAFGVVEGSLVGRGYILSWRKDSKAKSNKEERGADASYMYTTLVSLGLYNTCPCMGSNWIWL